MEFIFVFLFMVFLDRALPFFMRTYGGAIFPWGNGEGLDSFYKKYGWISLPRTIFLLMPGMFSGLREHNILSMDASILAICASMLLWFLSASYDVWRARR